MGKSPDTYVCVTVTFEIVEELYLKKEGFVFWKARGSQITLQ